MTPTFAQIEQAIGLITDPARAAARPGARALAWATMKAARGETHALNRLEPAPRVAETPCPEPLASLLAGPVTRPFLLR